MPSVAPVAADYLIVADLGVDDVQRAGGQVDAAALGGRPVPSAAAGAGLLPGSGRGALPATDPRSPLATLLTTATLLSVTCPPSTSIPAPCAAAGLLPDAAWILPPSIVRFSKMTVVFDPARRTTRSFQDEEPGSMIVVL